MIIICIVVNVLTLRPGVTQISIYSRDLKQTHNTPYIMICLCAGVRLPEQTQDGHEGRRRGDDLPAHLLHGGQLR